MSLHLSNITHSYGRGNVLSNVSADFGDGPTVLLGANGAGKSTLLEIVASVRRPKVGSVMIDGLGEAGQRGAALRRYRSGVAWLPQRFDAFPGLRVREHIAYTGWLKGMTKESAWDSSERALRRVDLLDRASERVSTLSGGQQRRVGLASALVHDARVILLDEPTAGLDPSQRRKFREVLAEVATGRTVLVASHDTDDAHLAFAAVAVLRGGELVFHDSLEKFVSGTDPAQDMRDRVEAAYTQWAGAEE